MNDFYTFSKVILIVGIVGVFVVAFILGILASNILSSKRKLRSKLKTTEVELESYQQDVISHFESSAQLMKTISDDYKNLYSHFAEQTKKLAKNAPAIFDDNLLLESTTTNQPDMDMERITDDSAQAEPATDEQTMLVVEEKTIPTTDEEPTK